MMKPAELLKACISILDTFDPKKTTVDAHCEASPVMKKVSEVEQKFIKQVFYGCVRYKQFLRIFVTGFLYKNPATAQRSDQTLYTVLAYLLIFRLRELGKHELKNFVTTASPPAMLAFLQFATSKKDLEDWVKMEWCKLYDIEYIENDIIGTIQDLLPENDELINEISLKATGLRISKEESGQKTSQQKVTVPEPFELTVPKPRVVPLPVEIDRTIRSEPVNPIIYRNTLAKVEKKNAERRMAIESETLAKYPETVEFRLMTEDRAADVDKLRAKYEAEKYSECTFKPDLPKPYMASSQRAEVAMNTAAILREDSLLLKKQEKEYAILKEYESDLKDCSAFYEWQFEMRKKDQLEELAMVEQRKIEMKMAREDAIEAKESLLSKNKLQAAVQKEKTKLALDILAGEEVQDLQNKRMLVEDVREERDNPRVAELEVQKARRAHAEELRKQKEVDLERVAKERAYEMAKKKDLIRQIRALERVSVVRPIAFDPSEPPRHGVLEEMSLAELRERLSMEKARREREVEVKRLNIIEEKNLKVKDIAGKADQCSRIREMAREESEIRREKTLKQKREEEKGRQAVREKSVLAAQEKIAAKKRERRQEEVRLRREEKEISVKRQFLQANAEMVEIKAYEEQQKGLEREAKTRQEVQIAAEQRNREILRLEEKIRKVNRKEELQEHKEVQDAFDKHMQLARIDDELFTAEIRNANKTAREMQRRVEDRLSATLRRDKPYAAKINDAIMEKVRTTQRLTNQRSASQRPQSTGRDNVDPLTMTGVSDSRLQNSAARMLSEPAIAAH
jgi:hypothetical protein